MAALRTSALEVMDRAGGFGVHISDLMRETSSEYPIWDGDDQVVRELDGVDRALAIRRIHARVSKTVGFARVKQTRVAPCPKCSGKLWNWVGESVVRCEGCPSTMTIDEHDVYCAELLEDR